MSEKLAISNDVIQPFLEALGITEPVGSVKLIFEPHTLVLIEITYVSHPKTVEGMQAICENLKKYKLTEL